MMATKLFVIANVKKVANLGSFRILLPFFRTSWGVGILNSAFFNSFRNRVEFGTILEGLRNFGGRVEHPQTHPPLRTPLLTPDLLVVIFRRHPRAVVYRGGFGGVQTSPPGNSEGPPKSLPNSTLFVKTFKKC